MSLLSPLLLRAPVVDTNRLLSRPWIGFLAALMERVGGAGEEVTIPNLHTLITQGTPPVVTEPTGSLEALVSQLALQGSPDVQGTAPPTPVALPDASLAALTTLRQDLEQALGQMAQQAQGVQQQLQNLDQLIMLTWPSSPAPYPSTFTPGSVIFAGASGALAQDNAQLFYDDTNNRLGVGTTAPLGRAQLMGALAVTPETNAFHTSNVYTALIIGHLSGADGANGGLYGVGRYVKANEAFVALSGWDNGTSRQLYYGGGGWNVPDATHHRFFTAATYDETNNAGALRLTIDPNGSVILGAAALATTATDGFLYLGSCAGAPTGVPTANAGRVACVYDTTNNKLWVYNGAWKGVVLA